VTSLPPTQPRNHATTQPRNHATTHPQCSTTYAPPFRQPAVSLSCTKASKLDGRQDAHRIEITAPQIFPRALETRVCILFKPKGTSTHGLTFPSRLRSPCRREISACDCVCTCTLFHCTFRLPRKPPLGVTAHVRPYKSATLLERERARRRRRFSCSDSTRGNARRY
jgi:hypothetical protein